MTFSLPSRAPAHQDLFLHSPLPALTSRPFPLQFAVAVLSLSGGEFDRFYWCCR